MAPSATTFRLVTVTNSAPALSAKSRGLIKTHIMKDIGLARRSFMWKDEDELRSRRVSSRVTARCRVPSHKTKSSELNDRKEGIYGEEDDESPCRSVIRLSKRNGGPGARPPRPL